MERPMLPASAASASPCYCSWIAPTLALSVLRARSLSLSLSLLDASADPSRFCQRLWLPGRINNRWSRWNLTLWSSADSGATWVARQQVEELPPSELAQLHTAYSTLVPLPRFPSDSRPVAATPDGFEHSRARSDLRTGIAYERGPFAGSHITPSKCGEYATIRWRVFSDAVGQT